MEGSYGVYFGNQQVGKVTVQRQGLYYRFCCRCRMTGEMVCRLRITCGDRHENLGIPVPVEGGFALETTIPVKRLGEGHPEFALIPKHENSAGTFVPIYPEEPFSYISKLKDAYLVRKNGCVGILIK